MALRYIVDIGCGGHNGMGQPRSSNHGNMGLDVEVPFVSFLSPVHVRITFARLVLRRRVPRRRMPHSNDHDIHNRTLFEQQALRSQAAIDRVEYDLGQTVRLQQAANLQQYSGVKRSAGIPINADKTPNGLSVADRIVNSFIGHAFPHFHNNIDHKLLKSMFFYRR